MEARKFAVHTGGSAMGTQSSTELFGEEVNDLVSGFFSPEPEPEPEPAVSEEEDEPNKDVESN